MQNHWCAVQMSFSREAFLWGSPLGLRGLALIPCWNCSGLWTVFLRLFLTSQHFPSSFPAWLVEGRGDLEARVIWFTWDLPASTWDLDNWFTLSSCFPLMYLIVEWSGSHGVEGTEPGSWTECHASHGCAMQAALSECIDKAWLPTGWWASVAPFLCPYPYLH